MLFRAQSADELGIFKGIFKGRIEAPLPPMAEAPLLLMVSWVPCDAGFGVKRWCGLCSKTSWIDLRHNNALCFHSGLLEASSPLIVARVSPLLVADAAIHGLVCQAPPRRLLVAASCSFPLHLRKCHTPSRVHYSSVMLIQLMDPTLDSVSSVTTQATLLRSCPCPLPHTQLLSADDGKVDAGPAFCNAVDVVCAFPAALFRLLTIHF